MSRFNNYCKLFLEKMASIDHHFKINIIDIPSEQYIDVNLYIHDHRLWKKIGQVSVISPEHNNIYNAHSDINDKMFLHKGYGPLLYDIALEYVTNYKHGALLSSFGNDHGFTSNDAEYIWKYYYIKRNDVEKIENLGTRKNWDIKYNRKSKPWLWCGFRKKLEKIPLLQEQGTLTIKTTQ